MYSEIRAGRPTPLGATRDSDCVNFALFSAHAEAVELCLFDPTDHNRVSSVFLTARSGDIWHISLSDVADETLYAYRVHGPWAPKEGHRFDASKLLIDPYARALSGNFGPDEIPIARIPAASDRVDRPARPHVAWSDTVIYETHVRGFTMNHQQVPEAQRGRYAGLAHPDVIAHLVSLGVTTIELMPCQTFVDEQFLIKKNLVNYWGYNTVNFFTPERRYQSSDSILEFAAMVDRLHEAGLEVILDVVYNHTAEGNHRGPTYSFRGIDNASYYRLKPDEKEYYLNYSGCGNTLDLSHPRVLQMVMDSLRYWVEVMGVDGFRFDLATALARGHEHFDMNSNFLAAISQDPLLSGVKMIAEPWDIGPDGYRVGQFPNGWSEWNDRYRDSVRRYWRQDQGQRQVLAPGLLASSDQFERHGRHPWASVNFVSSHDGYTLADICSYEKRHNLANGEDNRDGHTDNAGCNWGVEGPTSDRIILRRRDRHRRNMIATLLLSQGTPMLLAGDEFGRTQQGNNNAYCQDNELTWVDWQGIAKDSKFLQFVKSLIAFRATHPQLRQDNYLHADDARWYTAQGMPMTDDDWNQSTSLLILVIDLDRVDDDDEKEPVINQTKRKAPACSPLALIFNPDDADITVHLPDLGDGAKWRAALSTDLIVDSTAQSIVDIPGQSFWVFEQVQTT